ncbi:hypothetical protein T12_8927 [Trichinella patagoniensis]|uniref:Uncharacterized protein n=1 Tax=Trichinella patagoniensis TaxID=990121 RepID=A0A0V0ZUD4_9BILA|nr:hypothetical protein T12_8927 [Trichinella patagoniensis]
MVEVNVGVVDPLFDMSSWGKSESYSMKKGQNFALHYSRASQNGRYRPSGVDKGLRVEYEL